jgi:glycosyltransferase involved in cell wall biosynthesis
MILAQVSSGWMSDKLKIAVWYNLPTGGARRALYDHVRGLHERGHHVECFRPQVDSKGWMSMPVTEHEIPQRIIGDETSYLKRVIKHVARPTLAIKAMEDHSAEVAKRVKSGGFDILFANTCCQYHSPFIGRYVDLPKLLYLQEPNRFLYEALPHLAWLGAPAGSSWRRRVRAYFDLFALRRQANEELLNAKAFDRILVNSYFSRESVARVYGIDSQVCYLGIDTDHFTPADAPKQGFILGVGAIVGPKRVDLVIRAVGALEGEKPKLVWAGNYTDETYLHELRELAASVKVDVEFRFLIPDSELLDLMRTTSCVIYAPKLEPFGYVPLEAASCGAPVVTVAEGGLRESMAEGYGYIADPTPEAIAKKIRWVLDNQSEVVSQVRSNRAGLVEKWNLSAGVDRLEKNLFEVRARL